MSDQASDDAAKPVILVVTGLAREARVAAGPGVETLQAGGDPDRLRARLAQRTDAGTRAVLSFGLAGGLDPGLAPGDVVIASAVLAERRYACAPALVTRFADRLSVPGARVIVADLAGAEAPVLTREAKSALHAKTGAAAVDMESQVAAAHAARHGLPFGAIRVVCDPAERALPAFVGTALKPDGEPDLGAVLAALLRRETSVGTLVRLARDSGAAFRSLRRVGPLLGLALGVDA